MARNAKNTRMCSGCMARKDKSELICVNKFRNDVTIGFALLKKEGRSAYLCPSDKCMEKSIKKKTLEIVENLDVVIMENFLYAKIVAVVLR